MTGKEELYNVLGLVDMSKVDLPSYNISVKKYDIVARTYTKVIYLLSSLELRVNQKENDEEIRQFNVARKTIEKIINNPLIYCYDNTIQKENEVVQQATNDLYGQRFSKDNPYVHAMQSSIKKSIMIKNMKNMLDSLQQFANNNQEETIEFCMSDENFKKQIQVYENVYHEIQRSDVPIAAAAMKVAEIEAIKSGDKSNTPNESKKPSLWKQLFRKLYA